MIGRSFVDAVSCFTSHTYTFQEQSFVGKGANPSFGNGSREGMGTNFWLVGVRKNMMVYILKAAFFVH